MFHRDAQPLHEHTTALAQNACLFITDEEHAYINVKNCLLDPNYPALSFQNCGVATSRNTDTARDNLFQNLATLAQDWQNYSTIAFLPNSDYTALLALRCTLLHILQNHPALLPKIRIGLSPLFIDINQDNGDEYFNVGSTLDSATFIEVGRSHKYVAGVGFLHRPRIARLMESIKPVIGDWNMLNLNPLTNVVVPMRRLPDQFPIVMLRDVIFEPARLEKLYSILPHAVGGLNKAVQKAVTWLLKYRPGTAQYRSELRLITYGMYGKYGNFVRAKADTSSIIHCLDEEHGQIKVLQVVGEGSTQGCPDYLEVELTEQYRRLVPVNDFQVPRFKIGRKNYEKLFGVPLLPTVMIVSHTYIFPNNPQYPQYCIHDLRNDINAKLRDLNFVFPMRQPSNGVNWGLNGTAYIIHSGDQLRFDSYPNFMEYFFHVVLAYYIAASDNDVVAARRSWLKKLRAFYNYYVALQ